VFVDYVWDNWRASRQFTDALARLTCPQCGTVYGLATVASRRWAGITGPPAFLIGCPSCGDESVQVLPSWVDPLDG
jgi:hypothetical protein